MKSFDYCDIIFYQTLFFLDTYLSRDITELMPEKTIYYYLIGYFLCALKLKEVDIYEPSFDSFFEIEKGIYLSPNKIAFMFLNAINSLIALHRRKFYIIYFFYLGFMKFFVLKELNIIYLAIPHMIGLIYYYRMV